MAMATASLQVVRERAATSPARSSSNKNTITVDVMARKKMVKARVSMKYERWAGVSDAQWFDTSTHEHTQVPQHEDDHQRIDCTHTELLWRRQYARLEERLVVVLDVVVDAERKQDDE